VESSPLKNGPHAMLTRQLERRRRPWPVGTGTPSARLGPRVVDTPSEPSGSSGRQRYIVNAGRWCNRGNMPECRTLMRPLVQVLATAETHGRVYLHLVARRDDPPIGLRSPGIS
jgi:hypothetical protein